MGKISDIQVQFIYNGEKVQLWDNPNNENFLLLQEIQLMNELGAVVLKGTEYGVEEIRYCINESGARFMEIILN